MEDVNKRRRIPFSLSKLECAVLKKSTPGKFAYTCHFQQIGINAKKIEKTGIHFENDVFAAVAVAVAVVDAKAPYYMACNSNSSHERERHQHTGDELPSICPTAVARTSVDSPNDIQHSTTW